MSSEDDARDRSPHDPESDRLDRADSPSGRGPQADDGSLDDRARARPGDAGLAQLHQTLGNAFVQRLMALRAGPNDASAAVKGPDGLTIQRRPGHLDLEHLASKARPTDWPQVVNSAIAGTTAAINIWKATATLQGVIVNAAAAIGGTLTGPSLTPLILGGMAGTGVPPGISAAFAHGAGQAWDAWAASVRVPGLPWYPSFVAFPGPVAPPMPNIPTPLRSLGGRPVGAGAVAIAIRNMAGRNLEPDQEVAIIDFAAWFVGKFNEMLETTLVANVLGTGPVPTFAPPYVPVGPVIAGTAFGPPGFLVAGGGQTQSARPAPPGSGPTALS